MIRLILILYFLSINAVLAQDKLDSSPSTMVSSIEIEGNLRIEKSTIESYLYLKKSSHYSQLLADQSIKKLFGTGLFSDVNIDFKSGKLIVKIVENPTIHQVAFEGNKKLTKAVLLEQMTSKPRSVFSKTKLQQDISKLIEAYHRQGRYDVDISPKMIQLENNRINLVFEIKEGPETLVKNIYFIGNKRFSDNELKSIIHTKEKKWYKFWTSADNYDADIVEVDKEMLRKFYGSEGYFDCKIISAVAELTPSRDAFIISFSIEEGEIYKFGNISLDNKLKADPEKLNKLLLSKKGDIYNIEMVEFSVDLLIKSLNDQGFAFVNIEPEFIRNPDDQVVDVIYKIEEARKAYINRINIIGNVRTQDNVIRREFRLAEGDPFNATLIDRSEQRLKDLEYFKVELEKRPSEESPGNVDIDVKLEEKSTAKINLGGGITQTGKTYTPTIKVDINEDNLFGTGKLASLSLEKSTKSQSMDLSFTDPYFMNRDLAASVGVFGSQSGKVDLFPVKSKKYGSTIQLGYNLTEFLSHSVRYSYIIDKVSDISSDASELIQLQEGKTQISLVGHTFTYNRSNSRIRPTRGYWLKLDQSVAGLGGNARFINHEGSAGYYYPIKGNDLIFSLTSSVGSSISYGKQTKIIPYEGFNLGGTGTHGLRGFEPGGVGPRTSDKRRDSLGGKFYYKSSAELTFPLGLSKDLDISGIGFVDAGSLQDANLPKSYKENNKGKFFEDKSLRLSAGFGIVWVGPLGPIKIYYVPRVFLKKSYDITQKFHVEFFNMSF